MVSKRQARAERRSDLRAVVFDFANGMCEWPQCPEWATQLAHLHSIGMGGRESADTPGNAAAMCVAHALASDGSIPGHRGRAWYKHQLALLGLTPPFKAWNVAEALKDHVAQNRPGFHEAKQ